MSAPKPALNLKFGLNVNPRKAAAAASAAPRKPIFDADELEHDDEPQNSAKADRARVNASLKAAQSLSAKRAEEEAKKVLEEDPSVFDYDGVYDSIKGDEKKKKKEAEKKVRRTRPRTK